jgi:hypothetical protein
MSCSLISTCRGLLRHGIVVWIDMPLETVAKDTETRQLLVPNCADDEVRELTT